MSGGKATTYLVASKSDDASHAALGHKSVKRDYTPSGHDAEALELDSVPHDSRRPGGRHSIPSDKDWLDEPSAQQPNGNGSPSTGVSGSSANGGDSSGRHRALSHERPDSRVKRVVGRATDDEASDLSLDGIKPLSSSQSISESHNNNTNSKPSPPSAASSTSISSAMNGDATPSSAHPVDHPPHPPINTAPPVIIQSGHFSMQGIRPEMEDRVTLLPHPEFNQCSNLNDSLSRSFFAVFDGHGGDVSAEYCRQHAHNNLLYTEGFQQGRPGEGLKAALLKTEAEFCAACRRINLLTSSGTTAITAYIEVDMLYVANVGDSRAVVCRSGRAVDASVDHKPGRKDEKARIEALGGRVGITEEDAFRAQPRSCNCLWNCISAGRPLRVFPGGLSVSRTIGDISMKTTQLVSPEPELWEAKITAADEFLILACDGVWDVMNSQQAVDCVRGNLFRTENNAEEASKHLANEAFRRGSTDNISVVVITFEVPKKDGETSTKKK